MSPEHREVAELMLTRAPDDLRSSESLVATEDYAENVVGFLLQQAVEKSLKSILAAEETEIPRTHDLEELLQLIEDIEVEIPPALSSANWLTPWAVEFRYEDVEVDLNVDAALEAATAAIGLAEHVLDEDNTDPAA